jgi:hypothetical protein
MGEVCVVSTLDGSKDLDDTFREVLVDKIIQQMEELSTDRLLMVYSRILVLNEN